MRRVGTPITPARRTMDMEPFAHADGSSVRRTGFHDGKSAMRAFFLPCAKSMHAASTIIGSAGVRDEAAAPELAACSSCGQLYRVPDGMRHGADCVRCDATVSEPSSSSSELPLVLAYAALPLFAIALFEPLLSVRLE